jgi:hypothetical protein
MLLPKTPEIRKCLLTISLGKATTVSQSNFENLQAVYSWRQGLYYKLILKRRK